MSLALIILAVNSSLQTKLYHVLQAVKVVQGMGWMVFTILSCLGLTLFIQHMNHESFQQLV